ncbi:outer membrane beta-barrel protein, partial [Helicobacter sp. 13S00482-2]|uniref:outer membrane beta-barrel protein n=1 Tax=Helicobacter sp. 13S00482-2 TaxID=1476200 RepID=UPI00117B3B9F
TLAQAKFFLGIDAGSSIDRVDVEVEPTLGYMDVVVKPGSFTENAYRGNGYLFNFNLGTEHHFDRNNYVGFRWFLGLGYGRTTLINQIYTPIQYPSNIIEAKLGLDLLLDVIKFDTHSTLGFFGGVEGGVEPVLSDKFYERRPIFESSNPYLSARAGLSILLAEHHRIEFVAKIPVYTLYPNNGSGKADNIYKPLQFMLGYKFIF